MTIKRGQLGHVLCKCIVTHNTFIPKTLQELSKIMAMSPNKRLLLAAFLLLCFITMTASARSLREIKDDAVKKSTQTSFFKPNHEGAEDSNDELDTMDYTPAKRNPPIHN
ncbi:Root meristem growth factor 9 [Glycine max]|nr:Root meristem growth factor 9 [Glycine max]